MKFLQKMLKPTAGPRPHHAPMSHLMLARLFKKLLAKPLTPWHIAPNLNWLCS